MAAERLAVGQRDCAHGGGAVRPRAGPSRGQPTDALTETLPRVALAHPSLPGTPARPTLVEGRFELGDHDRHLFLDARSMPSTSGCTRVSASIAPASWCDRGERRRHRGEQLARPQLLSCGPATRGRRRVAGADRRAPRRGRRADPGRHRTRPGRHELGPGRAPSSCRRTGSEAQPDVPSASVRQARSPAWTWARAPRREVRGSPARLSRRRGCQRAGAGPRRRRRAPPRAATTASPSPSEELAGLAIRTASSPRRGSGARIEECRSAPQQPPTKSRPCRRTPAGDARPRHAHGVGGAQRPTSRSGGRRRATRRRPPSPGRCWRRDGGGRAWGANR